MDDLPFRSGPREIPRISYFVTGIERHLCMTARAGDSAVAPPGDTYVFMFTDIESSTEHWSADPDAMMETIIVHNETLRAFVESHGGRLVKFRGDGVHAVFDRPEDAITAALSVQEQMDVIDSPIELRIRVGIHSGPAIAHDGDFYGQAVNLAARLVDWAQGGQTVATVEMLTEADGWLVEERRVVELPGIGRPVEVGTLTANRRATDRPADRRPLPSPHSRRAVAQPAGV